MNAHMNDARDTVSITSAMEPSWNTHMRRAVDVCFGKAIGCMDREDNGIEFQQRLSFD